MKNLSVRAFTIVSRYFGSEVGPTAATSVWEPNFWLVSHYLCNGQLTTLTH